MFILVSVNQSYELTNYGTNRQTGTFNFEFLLVPQPDSTPPTDTFSVIMEYFQNTTLKEFQANNVTLISYAFDSGELVSDPTTGYVSLSFSINIVATQKQ
ncbi:hypothetical protein H2359_004703 [Salmonella enterica]|nr:hypothetical protein [Salmonella enterica subsp. enterica serovar Urbana]EFT5560774.1 hypothetical protein [Salmonella enterica]